MQTAAIAAPPTTGMDTAMLQPDAQHQRDRWRVRSAYRTPERVEVPGGKTYSGLLNENQGVLYVLITSM